MGSANLITPIEPCKAQIQFCTVILFVKRMNDPSFIPSVNDLHKACSMIRMLFGKQLFINHQKQLYQRASIIYSKKQYVVTTYPLLKYKSSRGFAPSIQWLFLHGCHIQYFNCANLSSFALFVPLIAQTRNFPSISATCAYI
jgi:hypothetical protein